MRQQSKEPDAAVASTSHANSARSASLRYVNDDEPGITRHKSGKGFRYRHPDEQWVTEQAELGRIQGLAVPPAWTDVWICPDDRGHIQATGRDQRGRKQYRYHPRWSETRDEVKFSSLAQFARALPRLRRQVERDLGKRGLPREKVIAALVWLLDNTMIRVGSASYVRENGSFGLTTLRSRHLQIDGSSLKFAFKGKSGKQWRLQLVDRRIARIVRRIQELPGQHLFQYVDGDGRSAVTSEDVNDYIHMASGLQFSSKHFRTWGGTVRALALFAQRPMPEERTAQARSRNEVIDEVAKRLGNTRAVCRKGYIHPGIIDSWARGELQQQLSTRSRHLSAELDRDEARTLCWLEGIDRSAVTATKRAMQ